LARIFLGPAPPSAEDLSVQRRIAVALALSGTLVSVSALAAAGSLGLFDGLLGGDTSAVYAPPVPLAVGAPTTTTSAPAPVPEAGEPLIVTLPRYVEQPAETTSATAAPPRVADQAAPPTTLPPPPVAAPPPATTTTAAPPAPEPKTATAPPDAAVPEGWPAGEPVPPMPEGCREPHLEDDGTWNCQH
jgi:hypothetical protein